MHVYAAQSTLCHTYIQQRQRCTELHLHIYVRVVRLYTEKLDLSEHEFLAAADAHVYTRYSLVREGNYIATVCACVCVCSV